MQIPYGQFGAAASARAILRYVIESSTFILWLDHQQVKATVDGVGAIDTVRDPGAFIRLQEDEFSDSSPFVVLLTAGRDNKWTVRLTREAAPRGGVARTFDHMPDTHELVRWLDSDVVVATSCGTTHELAAYRLARALRDAFDAAGCGAKFPWESLSCLRVNRSSEADLREWMDEIFAANDIDIRAVAARFEDYLTVCKEHDAMVNHWAHKWLARPRTS